jgi:hypothetical protein
MAGHIDSSRLKKSHGRHGFGTLSTTAMRGSRMEADTMTGEERRRGTVAALAGATGLATLGMEERDLVCRAVRGVIVPPEAAR